MWSSDFDVLGYVLPKRFELFSLIALECLNDIKHFYMETFPEALNLIIINVDYCTLQFE